MSKSDIKKVIVLGSGALKIGQAGEFDYLWFASVKGSERRRDQYRIAKSEYRDYPTSEGVADKVYFLPITPYFVEEVIKKRTTGRNPIGVWRADRFELRYSTLHQRHVG